ncbi:DNA polymerase III subunit alpha [Candidatus Bipolaricaulota bacterium]|nr:DNA polymerase III subunit alpha [Candidatus Bipolaricaulota bacterium]
MASSFVHLHVHSEYSILDSSCKISKLLDRAEALGMDAIALTDHGVMSGVIKFYRQAVRRNIKPIIGCEIYVAPGDRTDRSGKAGQRFYHLVLLAENEVGYRNLLQIVSCAHTEGFYYRPRADKALLREHCEGLIALSACESGEVPRLLQAGDREAALRVAREYESIFGKGNFYIEVQRHGTERDAKLRNQLVALAREAEIPLVATCDVHYLAVDDRLAHEVLLNVRANKTLNDPDHRVFDGEGYHFQSGEEMEAAFADLPEAIANTRLIADRCRLELTFGESMIPPFELPQGSGTANEYLRGLAYEGVAKRYPAIDETIRERMDYELSVIEKMDYSTYFLIVWDFVKYSKEHGISVGPGRGSAAGSLVSYCLGITTVDPLKYNLIFERFLNPDRISMPDFDIDFCVKGRDQVIDYVRQKYGGEKWWTRIAQIATYDRMAARSVVRDVGRVLGIPYSETDRVAKLIPFGWGLKQAAEGVAELKALRESDPEIAQLIEIGLRLEGLTRNASTHAAGVVIAPDSLSAHVPLLRLGEGEFVTQFDMSDVEAVGLLKFDFLGLRNLTLIDEARDALRKYAGIDICVESIPLDDEKTFQMLCEGKTSGIFQLESTGMTNLIRRIQPDRFEDLIALLALYRPGPLESGMTDEYVERRNGKRSIEYPHPTLKDVLEDTYGLPIYQDQIMLMARALAGFTLAEADILRKAMGKKDKALMASLRAKFMKGCQDLGVSKQVAEKTFDDMEKFSRYGFNKSHTTSYAFVSYWTAYLKANYPTHFMASLLTSVQGDLDKVADYVDECREMTVEILPPDINESQREFKPLDGSKIRFGLAAVKHVGGGAVDVILNFRTKPYESFFELCRRITEDGLDRETLEALIKCGAFDSLGSSRRGLLRHLGDGIELMSTARRESLTGQTSFFGDEETVLPDPRITEEEFDQRDLLSFEKELLGLYLTAHPLDAHAENLELYCLPLKEVGGLSPDQQALIGGRIKSLRRIDTKRGNQMAFVVLEDGKGDAEVTFFPKVLDTANGLIEQDGLVGLIVTAGMRNGEINLVAEEVFPLSEIPQRARLAVTLKLDGAELSKPQLAELAQTLQRHPGEAPVRIHLVDTLGSVVVLADPRFCVTPSEHLRSTLCGLAGVIEVAMKNGTTR